MVANVAGYLEDAYLIFTVEIFSHNAAVRKTNPKKVYCVDHSVAMAVSGSLTQDSGKVLENIVYMHIRRHTDRIYYARTSEGFEIDFAVLRPGQQISPETPPVLIQVAYDISDEATRRRELRALTSGMKEYRSDVAILITWNMEEKINTENGIIHVMPAWKFLLSRKFDEWN